MQILQTLKYKYAAKDKKLDEDSSYAICTVSVGNTEGTQERSKWSEKGKASYDRCLKHVDPTRHKKELTKKKKANQMVEPIARSLPYR
jgi:hypothetical protein